MPLINATAAWQPLPAGTILKCQNKGDEVVEVAIAAAPPPDNPGQPAPAWSLAPDVNERDAGDVFKDELAGQTAYVRAPSGGGVLYYEVT